MNPLTVESLARALCETRESSMRAHGCRPLAGKRATGVYEVRGWDSLNDEDKEIMRMQARLLLERMMR